LVEIGSNRVCKEYPIEILYCDKCFTAHQKYQVPKEEIFPKDYHYRARMTQSVLNFMSGLADKSEEKYGSLENKKVVDIGCNDGSLLNFFRSKGAITIGVDPTGAAQDAEKCGHDVYNNFFDKDVAEIIFKKYGKVDFITFTNVFAHIEDLKGLIEALKVIIGQNTHVIIENHYMGSILATKQFDTFYHEHPRTYSLKSFQYIAKSLGVQLEDVEFPSRYGGNIRVWMGNGVENELPNMNEEKFKDQFNELRQDLTDWKISTKEKIEKYVNQNGPIKAKAFPGRAAILVKLLNLDVEHISAVYEIKGSIKTGNYVPGTRIPILPEAELYKGDLNETILNLAWHLPKEVRANLLKNGYTGEVIDIK
jgi:SAM-dependent methyltransferase